MKRLGFAALMITLAATTLVAQPREGKNYELSVSGSYQHYSFEKGDGGSGALLISPRFGFFVVGGLELEPEVILMAGSGSDPLYVLNGLVSYNFTSLGKAVPFLLAGYGIANTVPLFNVPFTSHDFAVGVLNVGFGVKAFVVENVALRIEYRYQHFSGQGEKQSYDFGYGYGYSYTPEVDTQIHTVEFGFSILL